jgi:hypothetical protein
MEHQFDNCLNQLKLEKSQFICIEIALWSEFLRAKMTIVHIFSEICLTFKTFPVIHFSFKKYFEQ